MSTANGNLYRSATDPSFPGRGGTISFVRSYNGRPSHEHGPLGFGWTHSYDVHLAADGDGSLVFVDADGAR